MKFGLSYSLLINRYFSVIQKCGVQFLVPQICVIDIKCCYGYCVQNIYLSPYYPITVSITVVII